MTDMHDGGMVHNDFKVNNMVIDAGGNVRVIDLGSALFSTGRPVVKNTDPVIRQEIGLQLTTTPPQPACT